MGATDTPQRRTGNHEATHGRDLPLASLRPRLDEGSARGRWLIDPDGVLGRVLELEAGAAYTIGLALGGPVTLRARALLFPHDWRDRRGTLRAVVAVRDRAGRRLELFATELRTGDRGRPGGVELECELPAELALEVHRRRHPPDNAVDRAIFLAPTLHDPSAPALVAARAGPTVVAPSALGQAADGQMEPGPRESGPLFSVLVPVHDPPVAMLAEAIDSIREQTFPGWELCLSDDGCMDPAVLEVLRERAASDPRIKLVRQPVAGGISRATNAALEVATGRFIALLDHDDWLTPEALERVAARLAEDPTFDMVYTDEDIVDSGRQIWVHLKPAWSPDTLRTNGYTCHLGVYRRALVQEIGGFRPQFDGSQDIDMILRLTERTDRVAHVPGILYHWRAHAASTAGGDAKPYAFVAARNAYAAHLKRTGIAGTVGYGPPGLYRLAAEIDPATPVEIVLAVQSADGLPAAAASWVGQNHPGWALTLAAPPTLHEQLERALDQVGLDAGRLTLRDVADGEWPTSALAHAAADAAGRADRLLLLQAPVAGLTHGWLTRLLGYVSQPRIAAAGPVVLAADGRVAHAGVALPDGLALHLLHGSRTSMDDFFGYGTSVHNVSAVSGALLTPSVTFRELDGLDDSVGALSLVDYCIRAGESGGRIVTVPDSRLRMTVTDGAVNDLPAIWALARRWSAGHTGDPYYNVGYRADRGDFSRRES
jgi:GT2 family glycosyltransferase